MIKLFYKSSKIKVAWESTPKAFTDRSRRLS
jgi:hypothetical protein